MHLRQGELSVRIGRGEAVGPASLLAAVRHLVCIIALMWTPLVNGQPFFFQSDTTNYIRAADAAVYIASGKTFSTAWTDRYREQMTSSPGSGSQHDPGTKQTTGVNDVGRGMIMSGRSPYIGALMYLGYLAGNFWLFVLLQAMVAYGLIILCLRRFGVENARNTTLVVLALAATTALPSYNGMLLADAFAAFGILAFLLFATPGKLTRPEQLFLALVLLISVTAHLTHIMILIGMTFALGILWLFRLIPKPPARAWVAGVGGVFIGFLSVQLTAAATQLAFGKPPQLLPLLTARFVADGPGKAFIDAGCPGHDFLICHAHIGEPRSDALILFGTTPRDGAYMLLNADQRRLMGEQDTAFALAVLKYDPVDQLAAMGRNTISQLFWIDYDGLNQDCWDRPDCWQSLPAHIRRELRSTPSGQGLWPERAMNSVLYATVIVSLLFIAFSAPFLARHDRATAAVYREWAILILVGMLVCAFFGGAVAEPQYRYQGRLIWLVPFLAAVAALRYERLRYEKQADSA